MLQNRLAITRRSMVWLMLPFAVWLVVVGVLWSVQDYLVSSSVERVMALDLSERQVLVLPYFLWHSWTVAAWVYCSYGSLFAPCHGGIHNYPVLLAAGVMLTCPGEARHHSLLWF